MEQWENKSLALDCQSLVELKEENYVMFTILVKQNSQWLKTKDYNLVKESIEDLPNQKRTSYESFIELLTKGDQTTDPAFWLKHKAKLKGFAVSFWNHQIGIIKASAHILDVKSYSRYISDFNNSYLKKID